MEKDDSEYSSSESENDEENVIYIKPVSSWKRKRIDSVDYTSIENKKEGIKYLKNLRKDNPDLILGDLLKLLQKCGNKSAASWVTETCESVQRDSKTALRYNTLLNKLNKLVKEDEEKQNEQLVEVEDEQQEQDLYSHMSSGAEDMPSILLTLFGVKTSTQDNDDNDTSIKPSSLKNHPSNKLQTILNSLTNNKHEKADEILKFFSNLNTERQDYYIDLLSSLQSSSNDKQEIPYLFEIADAKSLDTISKTVIFDYVLNFQKMNSNSSEYNKKRNLIRTIKKIPFGKFSTIPIELSTAMLSYNKHKNKRLKKTNDDMVSYLETVASNIDKCIYGHSETKNQTMRLLASTISNGDAKGGHCFALCGPPGTGKTQIAGEIAKALGRSCVKLNMGGASNGEDLLGHGYTYEGSTPGKIVNSLIEAGTIDPVMIFDELDKVSKTAKGNEINNILIHMTDRVQNMHFQDKYISGVNIDLSNVIMVFTFNDRSNISPILLDRMKIIDVEGYKIDDKIQIANKHLIPSIRKELKYSNCNYVFEENILRDIINQYTFEGGVRRLRELLTDIMMEINLRQMTGQQVNEQDSFKIKSITKEIIKNDIFKDKHFIQHTVVSEVDQVGLVNGLWANSYGVGGLIPIEAHIIPTSNKFELRLTGMQGDVMKESMNVSKTVAWRLLSEHRKEELMKNWKKMGPTGIHIHCPDGSTPKDGPSAGGAITTCLLSVLSGKIVDQSYAMTGEINLKGEITAIGGLEEKVFGAITAGVKTVLYPKENQRDADKIIKKYPGIFDDESSDRFIKLIPVSKIEEIISRVLK